MTLRRRLCFVLLLGAVQSAAYFLCNHHPWATPRPLPLTALDVAIPFQPWTFWPYLLLLVLEPLLPLFVRRKDVFGRLLVAYGITMVAAFAFLALLPTTYPRPAPPTDDRFTSVAYRWFIAFDGPGCCFPSAHVLMPVLGCWALWKDGRRSAPLVALLCALLIPSTLTTKQHYVWDVGGALLLALVAIAIAIAGRSAPAQCAADGVRG